jgi:hypothetical protein
MRAREANYTQERGGELIAKAIVPLGTHIDWAGTGAEQWFHFIDASRYEISSTEDRREGVIVHQIACIIEVWKYERNQSFVGGGSRDVRDI